MAAAASAIRFTDQPLTTPLRDPEAGNSAALPEDRLVPFFRAYLKVAELNIPLGIDPRTWERDDILSHLTTHPHSSHLNYHQLRKICSFSYYSFLPEAHWTEKLPMEITLWKIDVGAAKAILYNAARYAPTNDEAFHFFKHFLGTESVQRTTSDNQPLTDLLEPSLDICYGALKQDAARVERAISQLDWKMDPACMKIAKRIAGENGNATILSHLRAEKKESCQFRAVRLARNNPMAIGSSLIVLAACAFFVTLLLTSPATKHS